jgi:hypothetical protein
VAAQISALAHDVFVSAYIDAMKSSLVAPIGLLALTALTTLLIKRRAAAPQAEAPRDEVRAAAG